MLVAREHRFDEGLHRLVGGLVGQVALESQWVAAQAVVDRLVGQQGVEDERARAQARLEAVVTASAEAPHVARGGEQAAEGHVESHGGAVLGGLTRHLGQSTSIAEVSSENSRDHAELPVCPFSVMIFSSGSVSRCGR